MDIQDDALIRQIIAGDSEAFRIIVERYRTYLFHAVYAVIGDQKTAEDVTQEAFVKIYTSLPCYQYQGFKTWITRIAVNRAIDIKRRLTRMREDLSDTLGEGAELKLITADGEPSRPEVAVLLKERRERLRRRLDDLPVGYRSVVLAHYMQDKSLREIADEENVALKTVEMRLYRAKIWMQKHWKEEDLR